MIKLTSIIKSDLNIEIKLNNLKSDHFIQRRMYVGTFIITKHHNSFYNRSYFIFFDVSDGKEYIRVKTLKELKKILSIYIDSDYYYYDKNIMLFPNII